MAVRVCVCVVVWVLFVGFFGCVPLAFCILLYSFGIFHFTVVLPFVGVVFRGFVCGLLGSFVRG